MSTARTQTLRRPVAPRAPRRVSGPARPRTAPRTAPRTKATTPDPLVLRTLRRGQAVADSRFLDRLVRGRLWIPIVAVALMGIVFMQVSMLKVNAGIGRAVQSSQTLERQNAVLGADVSRMESEERIAAVAHGLGMVVPSAGSFHYAQASRDKAAAARAVANLEAPTQQAYARAQGRADAGTTAPVAAVKPAATPAAAPQAQPQQAAVATQPTAQPQQQAAAPPAPPVVQPQPQPQPQAPPQQAAAPAPATGGTAVAAGGAVAPAGGAG